VAGGEAVAVALDHAAPAEITLQIARCDALDGAIQNSKRL
jgi:hypothetical protein